MSYLTTGTAANRRPAPTNAEGPELGDTRRFLPTAFEYSGKAGESLLISYGLSGEQRVTAEVVYVNREHRYFRTEYIRPDGSPAYECFKF